MRLKKRMMRQIKYYFTLKKIDKKLNTAEHVCTKTDGSKYNFNTFALPLKFVEKMYNYKITLDEAKDDQDELENLTSRLENHKAKKALKIEEKKKCFRICNKIV